MEICCVGVAWQQSICMTKSEMLKEEEGYRRRSSRIWALEEAAKFKQKEKDEKDKEAKEKLKAKRNASSSMPLPDRKRGRKKKRLEEVVVSAVSRVHFQLLTLLLHFIWTCTLTPTFFLFFFLYPF